MKNFLTIALFTGCVATAFAQSTSTSRQRLHLGIEVAPKFTWMSTPNDNSVSGVGSAFGVGLGIFTDYYFIAGNENYAFTLGANFVTNEGGTLQYSKVGKVLEKTQLNDFASSGTVFNSNTSVTYKNQFVEIPVGIKLRSEEVNGLRFFGNLPVVTFGIRTQSQGDVVGQYFDGTTFKDINSTNENIGNSTALFNLSVGGGAGGEYRLGETTTVIGGLYYQHGLIDQTNAFKRTNGTTGAEETDNSNAQLSGLSLRLGIVF